MASGVGGASASLTTTLEGQEILKEGWLTVFKSRNPFFLTKQKPDRVLERAWGVIHAKSPKGPLLSFYQDNRKESRVLKRDKVELLSVRELSKLFDHPKHSHCFTVKIKGKRNRFLFDCDSSTELNEWLSALCQLLRLDFRLEKVIWEFLDDSGLWQALSDRHSFQIETHYCEQHNQFIIGETELNRVQYHLGQMTRLPPKTRHTQRLKRTPFIWEKPETLHQKMKDLPAIWEWGDPSKDEWHPFERDTNIQIEDMYDSGSQWAELTLCMPSPMLLLLNLQDMKLVNSKTQVRHSLRRFDNSANMMRDSTDRGGVSIDPRTPSPDDDEDNTLESVISPVSPLFQPLQNCLQHLQIPRKNVSCKQLLGEGAFGEVYLAHVTGLPGHEGEAEVAVKQLRLSDFISRHGQHSQQMEDFLREAKEMAKVNHHRVVKLLAVCTLDFPLLLIEEYMNQGDLLAVLKEARPSMPLVQQLSFSWQVADGMNYLATELQCVHRDLAARNVMVHKTESNEMLGKIADFGLSRHLYSEMYKHQGNKPRPLPAKWMALESLMYFIFTTKSDVWSFGVLLWEIMTLGRTPYPGVENRELLEQIEEHGLKLNKPKGCPQPIYDIILDCTYHDPDDRPTFCELRDKLYDLLEDAKSGKLTNESDDEVSPPRPPSTAMPTIPIKEGITSDDSSPQTLSEEKLIPESDPINLEDIKISECIELKSPKDIKIDRELSEVGHVYYVIENEISVPEDMSQECIKSPDGESKEIKSPDVESAEIKSPDGDSAEIKSPDGESTDIESLDVESAEIKFSDAEINSPDAETKSPDVESTIVESDNDLKTASINGDVVGGVVSLSET